MSDIPSTPTTSASEIERLTGHGVVYRDGVRVLETDYDLMVTPAALRGATFESGDAAKGTPDITGRLLGSFFDAEALTGTSTLVLEDGRAFDFRVIQPDTNEIVAVSWFTTAPHSKSVLEREG
jgi:hypothetical protein